MTRRRARAGAVGRPRRRWGVFSLATLAVLAAAAWLAPAVLVHTSLRDRPLEAAFAGIAGRVSSRAATWTWLAGIEYRDVVLADPAGNAVVVVPRVTLEKGLLGLAAAPRSLGTVRIQDAQAVVAVRSGGSSLEDILAPWLAAAGAGGVACDLELVGGTLELIDTARSDAWRLTDLVASGSLAADGTISGWTVAGRARHAGPPAAPAAAPPPPDAAPPRSDRTTIAAAASGVLARDGGWSVSAPPVASGQPRSLAVTAHRLPLGISSVAATRLGSPRLIDGLADMRLDLAVGDAATDVEGRIEVESFAVCRADSLAEEFRLARCELPVNVRIAAGRIAIRELRAVSPLARGEVSGSLPVPAGDLWSWLEECVVSDCAAAAEIDLAAAAAALPGGLAVRPDVRVTAGSVQFSAVARADGADRILELKLDARDLAAVRTAATKGDTERPLRWNEPFTAWLRGRRGPGRDATLRIEEGRIASQAAELSAEGTPAALRVQWTVDLAALAGELAELLDFGGASLAGRSRGRIDVERAGGGATAARVTASVSGFEWSAPGRPTWQDESLSIDAEATWSPAAGGVALDSARGMVTAAGDSLEATLVGGVIVNPAALAARGGWLAPPPAGAVAECSLVGDLGRWHRRLAAVMPALAGSGLELAGSVEASAAVAPDAAAGGDAWRITRAGGTVEKFAAVLGDRRLEEPRLVATAAGVIRPLTGGVDISSAEILSSSLSLRTGGIAWQPGPPLVSGGPLDAVLARVRGRVQWQADLGRIATALAPGGAWTVDGRAWGTLDVAETPVGLNLLVEATGSQVSIGQPAAAAAGSVWSEPQANVVLELTRPLTKTAAGLEPADRLVIDRLAIESSTVAVAARGGIDALSSRRLANLEGTLSYDWQQISRLATPWTGGRVRLAGSGARPFSFRGPLGGGASAGPSAVAGAGAAGTLPLPDDWLAATRAGADDRAARGTVRPAAATPRLADALAGLAFDTSAAWTAGDIDGLSLAAGDMAIRLVEGQLAFGPFDLAASGGRLRGAPWIKLGAPGELVVPPGRIVERVALTGPLCNRFVTWVSPLLGQATNTSGAVSVDVAGVRLPLADPFAGEAAGQVIFEQFEVRPSGAMQPLVNLLGRLQAVVDPRFALGDKVVLLRVRPEPIRLRLAERRLWHEGLVMDSGQFTVASRGSVGADGSLAAVVEVAFRGDVAGQTPVVATLVRTPIAIPLKGTLARPQFDAGAIDVVIRRIVENTARAVINEGIGRGLEAVFGNPPAPGQPAPLTLPR